MGLDITMGHAWTVQGEEDNVANIVLECAVDSDWEHHCCT